MEVYLTEVVRYLAAQSRQIALLTLAVAVATVALRNRSAHTRYLLWLIVLAKCLVPPLFAVPLRVLPEKTASIGPAATPVVEPVAAEYQATRPSAPIPEAPPRQGLDPGQGAVTATAGTNHATGRSWPISTWAGIVWVAGAGLYLTLNLLRALRGQHWLHKRRRPLLDDMRQEMEAIASAWGRRGLAPIWIVDDFGQPFVWGLVRGSIYVPASFLKIRDAAHRRHVMAHELSHVVRFDAAVNLLQIIAQGLFWFHPFVWWVNRAIRQEREKCCDEMAVARLGAEAKAYCNAVVETLASAESSVRPVPSLAVAGPAKNIEERIKTMLKPGRRFYKCASPVTAIAIALVALMTVPTAWVLSAPAAPENTIERVPGSAGSQESTLSDAPSIPALPEGWSLDYDDGIRGGGNARTWKGQMANDLASLEIRPRPTDPQDTSWRDENYRFEVLSLNDRSVGTIDVLRDDKDRQVPRSKIFRPGKYSLRYRRKGGKSADNFRMYGGPFEIDLSRPGMYQLCFTPKLGRARITGSLGGCYAVNIECVRTDVPNVRGMSYQHAGQQYAMDGLPAGEYRLSAVMQMDGPNVFVSQAEATVGDDETVTVDIPAPPRGTCSLSGALLGRPRQYKTPWPTSPQSSGRWFLLIRNRGGGRIEKTTAYEALTMDSRYVVRSSRIVQISENTARYSIAGIAPGQYTVTAIEHPSFGGCTIERQQSKPLTLQAGAEAVLDFDLRDGPTAAVPPASASGASPSDPGRLPQTSREPARNDREPDAHQAPASPGRILHFPTDRSVGHLQIQEAGASRKLTYWFHWTGIEGPPWEDFGQARGEVRIPAGKQVRLIVNRLSLKNLSWLVRLGPNDLYSLYLPALSSDPAKASDACMPLIARLTGLRSLSLYLTAITDRGLSHITKLRSLEYLEAPPRMTDRGLAHLAKLPALKGLSVRASGGSPVTDAGLRHLGKLTSLEELYLRGERMSDAGLAHLAGLPRLEYLALYGSHFTDRGMVHVKKVPSLRILSFHEGACRITDAGLAHIAQMPTLELLLLDVTGPVTDEGMRHLAKMPSLRKLSIDSPLISDRGLGYLGRIKTLEHLTLPQDQHGITDLGLTHLGQLTNLRCLHVSRIHFNDPAMNKEYYTDRGLQALANCRLLEELSVGSPGITDTGVDHIAKLTGLKKLTLFGCDHLTDAGLVRLKALQALTDLAITEADVTISGINQLGSLSHLGRLKVFDLRRGGALLDLSGMTHLERLSLSFAPKSDEAFTDADLACLANLKTLRWLQIGPRDYTDAGLAHLSGLTNMERLNLGGSGLTDEGLEHLADMKKLDLLSITGPFDGGKRDWSSGGHFTDEALRTLEQFKQLTLLEVYSDTAFSEAAVRRLREALPNLYSLNLNGSDGRPTGMGVRAAAAREAPRARQRTARSRPRR